MTFFEAFVDEFEKVGKKWIQKAIEHPGGLHRSLGIPQGEDIPESKKREAAKRPGKVGKQARLALTLKKITNKRKKKKD